MVKYLLIDSKFRSLDSNYSTDFKIYFNKNITIDNYIKISYLNIPRCNYLITNKNNSFKIIFSNDRIINIIIPDSNYSPLQLADCINLQSNINNFNITYNNQNFKYTFNSNISFQIDFTTSNFYKLLRIEKKIYYSNNNKLISNIIFFNYPLYLNLIIKNLTSDNFTNTNQYQNCNFILPCGSLVNFGEMISYSNINYNIKMNISKININYMDILIVDDDGNTFDNNRIDFFIIFEYD